MDLFPKPWNPGYGKFRDVLGERVHSRPSSVPMERWGNLRPFLNFEAAIKEDIHGSTIMGRSLARGSGAGPGSDLCSFLSSLKLAVLPLSTGSSMRFLLEGVWALTPSSSPLVSSSFSPCICPHQ